MGSAASVPDPSSNIPMLVNDRLCATDNGSLVITSANVLPLLGRGWAHFVNNRIVLSTCSQLDPSDLVDGPSRAIVTVTKSPICPPISLRLAVTCTHLEIGTMEESPPPSQLPTEP